MGAPEELAAAKAVLYLLTVRLGGLTWPVEDEMSTK